MWSDEFRTEMLTVTVPLLARLRPTSLPQSSLLAIAGMLSPVLGIRNILVRIRIRGFIPLTNVSGPGPVLEPAIFFCDFLDSNFVYYFLKQHLYHFQR